MTGAIPLLSNMPSCSGQKLYPSLDFLSWHKLRNCHKPEMLFCHY